MYDLIKINQTTINGAEVNSVNARELHEVLEVKKAFTTWISTSLDNAGAIEGEDYIKLKSSLEGSGYKIDYIITTDMSKHIAMMSKVPKAKKVRDYFIEVEKKYAKQFQIPKTYSEALMLAAKQAEKIEQQEKMLLEQKPKVEFFDAVTNSKTAIDMAKVAKILDKNIGRNKLFQFLRDKKILQRDNIPFQTYIDRGYFRVIETKYTKPDGSTHINLKTLVYQKGVNYINKLLCDA